MVSNESQFRLRIDHIPPGAQIIIYTSRIPDSVRHKIDEIVINPKEKSPQERLQEDVLRLTNVMSQNNWDAGLLEDHADMDQAITQLQKNAREIALKSGQKNALDALNSALEQVGRSQYFIGLIDAERKFSQLSRTARTHFKMAFDTPQARSVR